MWNSADNNVPEDMMDSFHITDSNARKQKRWGNCISLLPFGLATYKLQGGLWRNPETSDDEMINSLHSAAYSWLKQLGVDHHDFDFFTTH